MHKNMKNSPHKSEPQKCNGSNRQRAMKTRGGGNANRLPTGSSSFRGVSRHKYTGRYEVHLWDRTMWNSTNGKQGKQVYLGAYDDEEAAARTYDIAAIKLWGTETRVLNFPKDKYTEEIKKMGNMPKEELFNSLRRTSSGFSRGISKYRGVARHHPNGSWEARIGRVRGNRYMYLGTFSTEEEAATAYDMAAIEHKGLNVVTNFETSVYADRFKNLLPNYPNQQQHCVNESSRHEKSSYPNGSNQHHNDQSTESGVYNQYHQQEEDVLETIVQDLEFPPSMLQIMGPNAQLTSPRNQLSLDVRGFNPASTPDVPFENDSELLDIIDFTDTDFIDDIDKLINDVIVFDEVN